MKHSSDRKFIFGIFRYFSEYLCNSIALAQVSCDWWNSALVFSVEISEGQCGSVSSVN